MDRVRDWLANPMVRVGGAAGFGGLVLGLVIGVCAGGSGDAEAPVVDAVVTTLPPLVDGGDTTTTAPVDQGDGATTTTAAPATALDRNPLTGELLDDPVSRRIVAVKVDNVPAAQPQIGLNEAELVFEIPVEGGITRFTALYFLGAPPVVGPVRSIREIDAVVLAPFTPLLLTTGGQDFVERHFGAADITIVDPEADGLFGVIDRPRPHHTVALLEFIDQIAGDITSAEGAFTFSDEFAGGDPATSISIPFSAVTEVVWRFENDQYVRAQNGETSEVLSVFDGTPEPFVRDTIVVLKVAQRSAGYNDSSGAEVLNFDVVGFGDALVFHGGEVVEGRWLRSAQEDGWVLVDDDGGALPVPAGRLLVEVVPRFVDVTFS